nr:hypothetical protein [Tanacetum cinerariifolium]
MLLSLNLLRHLWNVQTGTSSLLKRTSHVNDAVMIKIYLNLLLLTQIKARSQDYTIVPNPRAIIYKDRNDEKKMMRENEVHKFSDGTLTRFHEKLDHMVKDFRLFKYNPGMDNRIWSEDDKMRSKEFMEVIDRRLKIKRIF